MSRFFTINPDNTHLLALKDTFVSNLEASRQKRNEALKAWGGNGMCYMRGRFVVALHDPRKFDPPQKLPKGWKRFDEEYITNSTHGNEAHNFLRSISDPFPYGPIDHVLNLIYEANPGVNGARIYGGGAPRTGITQWSGQNVQGNHVIFFTDAFSLEISDPNFLIQIPDTLLRYGQLEGLTEIPEWQAHEYVTESNRIIRARTDAKK